MPAPDGFDVVVEQVVGRVSMNGSDHPFRAAMQLVADHQVEADITGGRYFFPGVGPDETVVVNIEVRQPQQAYRPKGKKI